MIIRVLILVGLVRLLLVSQKPLLCTGIYTACIALFTLIGSSAPFGSLLLAIIMQGALAHLYFWLLHRFEDEFWFWVILVGGLAIGMV